MPGEAVREDPVPAELRLLSRSIDDDHGGDAGVFDEGDARAIRRDPAIVSSPADR
jgi:hypothetical protein